MAKEKPYTLHKPKNAPLSPVVFDSPHSGTALPAHFRFACAREDLSSSFDPHVEKLLADIPARGVPVLENTVHRAVIDLNRHEFELTSKYLKDKWPGPKKATYYARTDLGIFPLRVGTMARTIPVYDEETLPDSAELKKRLTLYHRPYHEKLDALIACAHKTHGFSLHFNMHSMKRFHPPKTADIVIGDRFGKSCDSKISRGFVKEFFEKEGFSVAINDPFAGAAGVQKHGNRKQNRHSIQIEIARDLYMDQTTGAYDEAKGAKLKDVFARFAVAADRFARDYAADLKVSSPKTSGQQARRASSTAAKPGL
jgi:N-formylglutamate deformylase